MNGIFISYRRDDAAGHAGRLLDRLAARFGAEAVFMDVSDIPVGADFVQVLDQALDRAATVLVVIGPRWLDVRRADGQRRLDDPGDFVRIEVSRSLARGVKVVPVLVQKAPVPAAADLPSDMRPLVGRQAIELTDTRWDADVAALVAALEAQGAVPVAATGNSPKTAAALRGHAARNADAPAAAASAPLLPGRRAWLLPLGALAVFGGGLLWWRSREGAAGTTDASNAAAAVRAGGAAAARPAGAAAGAPAVPDVVGLARTEAEARLRAAGFGAPTVRETASASALAGTVVAQMPAPGRPLAAGDAIELTVVQPPADAPPVDVPNLTLYTEAEARASLAARGLRLGTVSSRLDRTVKPGLLVQQSIAPGAQVARGTAVDIVLGAGARD